MLEKIDTIKKVGLYDDYIHSPECDFGEVTLVYGENGVGKSTIAAILDSLREGNGTEVLRRKSLSSDTQPSVSVTLNSKTYSFSEGAWDAQPPYDTLDVFFPGFVTRNVHAVCTVDPEHRRNLCELVLGREAVKKVTRLTAADGEARKALAEKNQVEKEIKLLVKAPDSLEAFLGFTKDSLVDEKLEDARKELRQAREKNVILARPVPQQVPLPVEDQDAISTLLKRNSQDVGAGVATIVRQHVSGNLDTEGENWLSYGSKHTQENKCPFCAQDLDNSSLAKAIREYFSEEYQVYTTSISSAIEEIRISLGSGVVQGLRSKLTAQVAIAVQWAGEDQIDQSAITSGLDAAEEEWKDGATRLRKLFTRKLAQPLASMDPASADDALAAYRRALKHLEGVNTILLEWKNRAEKKKEDLAGADTAEITKRVNHLENKKARFEPLAEELINRRSDLLTQREDLNQEKADLKNEIDERADRVASKYQDGINFYLNYFGCDIRIESVETGFPAGKASVNYKLKAHGREIPLGLFDAEPCFDTVLSEGDKYSFALSFFFARLKGIDDLSGRTVVLDDPVNSLGSSRRVLIELVIRDLKKRGAQVIVLTHDERLAALMWRDKKLKGIIPLHVQRTIKGSQIGKWDIERALQSDYVKAYISLSDFLSDGGEHREASAQIRPYVEQRLRHMYPGPPFHTRDSLGDMIGKIRNSKAGSQLQGLTDKLPELEAINDAALPSHHATDDVPGLEPLSPEEVRLFAGKALSVL